MGFVRQLHPQHGDVAVKFDVDDPKTVKEAMAFFEGQMAEGKVAIRTDTNTVERTFDPKAEEYVIFNQFQGG